MPQQLRTYGTAKVNGRTLQYISHQAWIRTRAPLTSYATQHPLKRECVAETTGIRRETAEGGAKKDK
ncbi:hypothetical protein E2C01_017674 [Portunus trituberculatus]|uniref:Uncharacterized protein n=1 Tax=Portunus trituberculatus TaxID=210409 RepID=A0A5B7DT53_PORTR|nr:hypothetical protein [Portunus trituberculatus]